MNADCCAPLVCCSNDTSGNRSLKVLIVHPHIRQGGAEKHIVYFAYWLKKMEVDVRIATLSTDFNGMPEFVNDLDFVVPENSSLFKSEASSVLLYLRELAVLRKLVKEHSNWADIIETHHFPTYWSTFDISKPKVLVCHESYTGCYPGQIIFVDIGKKLEPVSRKSLYQNTSRSIRAIIDRWIVKNTINAIVVLEDDDYSIVKACYGKQASIIPPGIDFEFYQKGCSDSVFKKYDFLVDSFVILQVGELSVTKNQVASINAARLLRNKIPKLRLVLVGSGPLDDELRKLVKEYHLEDIVFFTGKINELELRDWYHACRVNLFPSEVQSWGMAPFEGLAAGKPIVVSKKIGSAKMIERARIGLLIDPTPEAIADSVINIYLNPAYYDKISLIGQEFVQNRLSWALVTGQLLQLMYKVQKGCSSR